MKCISPKESRYYNTYKEFLIDIEKRYGTKTAISTYRRGAQLTEKSFTALKNDAFAFAASLFSHGLSGEHIAMISENSYEWLTAYFGIAISGGVAVCIDTEHADDTVEQMVRQADAKAIFSSASLCALSNAIQSRSDGKITTVITVSPRDKEALSFEQFVREGQTPEALAQLEKYEIDPMQTAAIVYTSGTTSSAKPVMLSHRAILYNAADSLTILDSREKIFNSLPLYHTYGLTCGVLCGLIRGIQICISCDVKRMLQEMTLFKPQLLVAVPLVIEAIYKTIWGALEKQGKKKKVQKLIQLESALHKPHLLLKAGAQEAFQGTCLENLNVILSGGAHLEKNIAGELAHFGIVVLQGYGITECSPSVSCNRNEDYSLDSVGMILPGNEVKFQDGEILVRGYSLMSGYYNAPALTAESMQDGWFKTGDLGYLDKKGHLHITGRKKNLIVMKNGKKIAAEEMESKMRACPFVREVMIYGASSGSSMDDVKIAAMVYPNPALTENMSSYEILEQLQSFVDTLNAQLPIYKQIQMINIRDTDFERTAAHKIKR